LSLTALRLLSVIGRDHQKRLSAADTHNLRLLFPPQPPHGERLVRATPPSEAEPKTASADMIRGCGAEIDSSGEPAISEEKINVFFTRAQALHDWHLGQVTVAPVAEKTPAAAALLASLREKIEDYFSRVKLVAFDPPAAATING